LQKSQRAYIVEIVEIHVHFLTSTAALHRPKPQPLTLNAMNAMNAMNASFSYK
jgi:hypothetical protein